MKKKAICKMNKNCDKKLRIIRRKHKNALNRHHIYHYNDDRRIMTNRAFDLMKEV